MSGFFAEILGSISRNKIRTSLTGFSVAWGIFMIIVLVGAGNGLMNAFQSGQGDVLTNTMMVGGGNTSIPSNGFKAGRWIRLDDNDVSLTGSKLFADNIDQVCPALDCNSITISNGKKHRSASVQGIYPGYFSMNKMTLLSGRYINDKDIEENRKVVVISTSDVEHLFGAQTPNDDVIGKNIRFGDFSFKIIGVYKAEQNQMYNPVHAPYTTMKTIYKKGRYLDNITFSFHGLNTMEENEAFENNYRAVINTAHQADPKDKSAMWIWNRFTQNMQMEKGNRILNIALWIIGLFTLVSGIVGVSNIMLITVRERTHEFGIRKAIGATPRSVVNLILAESISITLFFGYIGMTLGILACEILDKTIGQKSFSVLGESMPVLKDPTVDMGTAIGALAVLVIAGTLAGLAPAIKAARIRPIEALKAE